MDSKTICKGLRRCRADTYEYFTPSKIVVVVANNNKYNKTMAYRVLWVI